MPLIGITRVTCGNEGTEGMGRKLNIKLNVDENYLRRQKTRHRKRLGESPPKGTGKLKCRMCGKPYAKHETIDFCNG